MDRYLREVDIPKINEGTCAANWCEGGEIVENVTRKGDSSGIVVSYWRDENGVSKEELVVDRKCIGVSPWGI